ncbi:MAG: sulfite exporter TauE/SafE family protein [Planctomycetota bacterium]|jgi:uncharacterized membrane protein YfcA
MMPLDEIHAFVSGPALLAVLVGLGLAVGVLTGLFGVGGAFLVNPVLMVALGISEPLVIGSSLSFTIGAGSMGAARHMRSRNVDLRSTCIIGLGAVGGAVLGADLLGWCQSSLGTAGFKVLIRALYFVLLLLTALLVLRNSQHHSSGKSLLQRLRLPPRVALPGAALAGVSLPGLVLVGLAIGLVNGMLGIGGGVLFMPLLLLAVGMAPHKAVGTSLGVVLFSSISGTIKHGLAGNVSLMIVMPLLVGSSVGVQLGAAICDRLGATRLRRYFAGIVLLTAAMTFTDLAKILIRG